MPPAGTLLDLVTGATTLTESLALLARTAAIALAPAAGPRVECGVVLYRNKRGHTAAATAAPADALVRLELEAGEGPLTDALSGKSPTAINRSERDLRWPHYARGLRDAGFHSALGVRLQLDGGAKSALVFLSTRANVFHHGPMTEALTFAGLASRSLGLLLDLKAARSSASDLRSALESRTSIDIACGVIMAQNRCSYGEAIAIIAKASSHRNIKLRRVAEDILDGLPGGAPQPHFDH
ncbi:MAG: hypothetical protein JWQ75_3258 [Pseudarthrobacter sp.]|nr:hypothetical protein [Pseudarthrobacter sp.]